MALYQILCCSEAVPSKGRAQACLGFYTPMGQSFIKDLWSGISLQLLLSHSHPLVLSKQDNSEVFSGSYLHNSEPNDALLNWLLFSDYSLLSLFFPLAEHFIINPSHRLCSWAIQPQTGFFLLKADLTVTILCDPLTFHYILHVIIFYYTYLLLCLFYALYYHDHLCNFNLSTH
jgi:hypothetical protein